MMASSLKEMVGYYLPSRGSQLQSAMAMPFSEPHLPLSAFPEMLDESLTTMELHENSYKIISYGSSINVYAKQTIGSQRLSRYGLSAPTVTTLQERGWVNKEPINIIQDRFVAEMTKRIGTFPEEVDIPFLARKLKAYIPTADLAKDKYRRVKAVLVENKESPKYTKQLVPNMDMERESSAPSKPLEFAPVSGRQGEDSAVDDELFVPTWGQYVRSATRARQLPSQELPATPEIPPTISVDLEPEITVPENNHVPEFGSRKAKDDSSQATTPEQAKSSPVPPGLLSESQTVSTTPTVSADKLPAEATETPPKSRLSVLEQTIQWSSSNEILFIPQTVKEAQARRIVVSPRDVQDHLYLDDPLFARKTYLSTSNGTLTTPKKPTPDKNK